MAKDDNAFDLPAGFLLPPVHPGRTLEAELAARELSAHALALKLRVPANRISEIVGAMSTLRTCSVTTPLAMGRMPVPVPPTMSGTRRVES